MRHGLGLHYSDYTKGYIVSIWKLVVKGLNACVNPIWVWRTVYESIKGLRDESSRRGDPGQLTGDRYQTRVLGQLIASLAFSEAIATYVCAPLTSICVQYLLDRSPMQASVSYICADYLVGLGLFLGAYAFLSRAHYREYSFWLQRVGRFAGDMLPLLTVGLLLSGLLYLMDFGLAHGLVKLLGLVNPVMAARAPVAVYIGFFSTTLSEALFLQFAMAFLATYAAELAASHQRLRSS